MFPYEGGQGRLTKNTKGQWDNKEKDSYKAESGKESCVKKDRQITKERDKQRLEEHKRCGTYLQKDKSICYMFVNVKFDGGLKFAGTVKI